MLSYLYHALEAFRSSFSRQRSWLLFSAIIISFMAAPEMIGVTSMCRFWRSDEHGYQRLLHFFSISGLSLSGVVTERATMGVTPTPRGAG